MGFYIDYNSKGEALRSFEKYAQLILDGATPVEPVWHENLCYCAENDLFDAIIYCYDEKEFQYIIDHFDDRPKSWLIHPMAKKLSGFEK